MKKAFLLVLMMTAAFTVFAQSGVVRALSGTVELKAAGAADYVPAEVGDSVSRNTLISTGFRSTALVAVGSTVIAVRPLTRLTLTEISEAQGSETLNVSLQTGRVRVNVNPPAGTRASMAVSSPSATASVRGTSFDFDTRSVNVSEGIVSFRGTMGGYPLLVGAGSSSGINWNGAASAPQYGGNAGYTAPPVGTDTSAGNTGGTGVVNEPAEPDRPVPPPDNPTPDTPPSSPSGPGGFPGTDGPDDTGGGVGVDIDY